MLLNNNMKKRALYFANTKLQKKPFERRRHPLINILVLFSNTKYFSKGVENSFESDMKLSTRVCVRKFLINPNLKI